jgi:hypothetical protein
MRMSQVRRLRRCEICSPLHTAGTALAPGACVPPGNTAGMAQAVARSLVECRPCPPKPQPPPCFLAPASSPVGRAGSARPPASAGARPRRLAGGRKRAAGGRVSRAPRGRLQQGLPHAARAPCWQRRPQRRKGGGLPATSPGSHLRDPPFASGSCPAKAGAHVSVWRAAGGRGAPRQDVTPRAAGAQPTPRCFRRAALPQQGDPAAGQAGAKRCGPASGPRLPPAKPAPPPPPRWRVPS